jgi:DNA-binding HxlR family transcriptional regulator
MNTRCLDEHSHLGVEKTMEILGDKWTVALIHHLVQGKNRFGLLRRAMKGISPKTLALRLRSLEAHRIIRRKIFPEVPLHIEYRLTKKGKSLGRVLRVMEDWGSDLEEIPSPDPLDEPRID